jgi:hypothetical protein
VPAALDKAWAGIDIDKRHHWVCVVDQDGSQLLSVKVANDEAEITAVIGPVTGLAATITDLTSPAITGTGARIPGLRLAQERSHALLAALADPDPAAANLTQSNRLRRT